MSTFADGYLVVHVTASMVEKKLGSDLLLVSMRKAEIATVLTDELGSAANGSRALQLNFADTIPFRSKMAGAKYLKAKGVETRKLVFEEDKALASKGAVAELDMESAVTKQPTVRVSPALGSEAPLQLHSDMPERNAGPRKSIAR
eukprot:4994580-Prymnesium_polylepis.1